MRPLRGVLLLTLALLVAPLAAAQTHEHGHGARIAIVGSDGERQTSYAGTLSHFNILDLGADNLPAFHEQNHIRVSENGAILYETTLDSGHDYDGVVSFDVRFPVAGNYSVFAEGEKGHAWRNGTVRAQVAIDQPMTAGLDVPATVPTGVPVPIQFSAKDATGSPLRFWDALVEIRAGETLQMRTHTRGFDKESGMVEYAFPAVGAYTVQLTVYEPDDDSGSLRMGVAEAVVTAIPSAAPSAINPNPPAAGTDLNHVAKGNVANNDFQVIGTFDPYTLVGPTTQQHLTFLAIDPTTGMTVPDIDFTVLGWGPAGQSILTFQAYEEDGIFELTTVQPVAGAYHFTVEAKARDGRTSTVDATYEVAPPVVAVPTVVFAVGPQLYDISGLDGLKAGLPQQVRFAGHDRAGTPFAHSEVDVQVLNATGIPVLQTKLHTHDDGVFLWNLTLPEAGDYTLRLSPFPLMAQPVGPFYGAALGDPLTMKLTVAAGPGIPAAQPNAVTDPPAATHQSPGAPLLLLLTALGLALASRRRTA